MLGRQAWGRGSDPQNLHKKPGTVVYAYSPSSGEWIQEAPWGPL